MLPNIIRPPVGFSRGFVVQFVSWAIIFPNKFELC